MQPEASMLELSRVQILHTISALMLERTSGPPLIPQVRDKDSGLIFKLWVQMK